MYRSEDTYERARIIPAVLILSRPPSALALVLDQMCTTTLEEMWVYKEKTPQ